MTEPAAAVIPARCAVIPAGAVILAGGRGSRLGGMDKPALRLGERTLLDIAIAASVGGRIVVVGPDRDLPAGVTGVVEDPPGGGPAAAVVSGVRLLADLPDDALVAVLASDLPGITRDTVTGLCAALSGADPADTTGGVPPGGAVLVDPSGRRQYLIGVWRRGMLTWASGRRPEWSGVALRDLIAPIAILEVPGSALETADIDTPDDWRNWERRR